ncbi:MAG TPA: hypothetical protein VES39_00080 [Rhodospirillales bacterium]|nr:hypothetical protein [Rhodospirillales bacterium]
MLVLPVLLLAAAVAFVVVGTARGRLHPFVALLAAAVLVGPCADMSFAYTVRSIGDGFTASIGSIALVIVGGSMIEVFLRRSRAGERLAAAIVRAEGRGGPAVITLTGAAGGVAAACDAAFALLMPLAGAIARRSGRSPVTGAIALALALSATNGLLPPAPGPVAAAAILSADLGRVALWGGGLAAILCLCGWAFAIGVRPPAAIAAAEAVDANDPPASTPRSPLIAALPILLPMLLLMVSSLGHMPSEPLGGGAPRNLLLALGHPVTLLLVASAVVLLLPRPLRRSMLAESGWVGEALARVAATVLVVGAGGGFARVLQNAGIGHAIADTLVAAPLGILLPFAIAAVLKTAHGSSLLATISTAGVVEPLLPALGLDGEAARALTVAAIGAGALVVSHANDSLFWMVTRLTGLTPAQGYRLLTLGTLLQGAVAAAILASAAAVFL